MVVVLHQVAVGVPVVVVVVAAGVDLDEAHAALDQPPGQQALPAERRRVCVSFEAVQLLASPRSPGARSTASGACCLHLEGQLVAGDAGGQLGVVGRAAPGARCCTRAACRAARAARLAVMPAGRCRSRIGVAAGADDRRPGTRPACSRSTSSSAPLIGPPRRVEHDDEAGQVLVDAAQAVVDPRAQARAAAEDAAGVHHAAWPSRGSASRPSSSAGRRCRRRSVARCGNRSLTHLPHWPYCLNFQRGSTMRPSFLCPPRPNVLTVTVLPSQPVHGRLVVEGVDVARAAVHEEEDDALRLGGEVRLLRRQRVDELRQPSAATAWRRSRRRAGRPAPRP